MQESINNTNFQQLPPPIDAAWFEEMNTKRAPFLVRLFRVFVQEEPKRVGKIKEALDARDYTELKNLAHSLKGGAATLGCDELRQRCLDLEMAALDHDPALSEERFRLIEEEVDRVFGFMQDYLKEHDA